MDDRSEGPDGSSIRPVSSLLARFESIHQAPSAAQPTLHQKTPVPKPAKLRSFKPNDHTSDVPAGSPSVVAKEKPTIKPKPLIIAETNVGLPSHTVGRSFDKATGSSATDQTPSVTIQPPQSPPKRYSKSFQGDRSPFLDPVSDGSRVHSRSPTPLDMSSRPLSPSPSGAVTKSLRLGLAKPPSPPPPRRSGEFRRDRETKSSALVPETRPNKTPSPASTNGTGDDTRRVQAATLSSEVSPFTSPPSTPEEADESPPQLPVRPRHSLSDAAVRPRIEVDTFMPPPIHHTVVERRGQRDEVEANLIASSNPARSGRDERPSLPARRKTHELLSSKTPTNNEPPPQQPPRTSAPRSQPSAGTPMTRPDVTQPAVRNATIHPVPPPPTRNNLQSRTGELNPSRGPDDRSMAAAQPDKPLEGLSLPNISNVNRKPPFVKKGCYEVQTRYDPRLFDVCGEVACTSGQFTRVWNILDGEQVMSFAHTEGVKATAVAFKPCSTPDREGSKVWIGTNTGDIMEVDVASNRITYNKADVHSRYEVTRIHRYYNELWTLDEGGNLAIWGPDSDGMPNLSQNPSQTYKVPKGHTFSLVVGGELWYATGKVLRVFEPSLDGSGAFQVLSKPLVTEGAGEITSGTTIREDQDNVYFGHLDGRISVYSTSDYTCRRIVHVSGWKINTMAGVGSLLWIGHNTGKLCIYDTSRPVWRLRKEWHAHDSSVYQVKQDHASAFRLDRLQTLSLGADGKIRIWDGMLQDDWLEDEMKVNEASYCNFNDLKALFMTWNAGASTPNSLRYASGDAGFFQELLRTSDSPDILVFGFQELVDLEDKTATAKRLLKSKKKDGPDTEKMSHQYRDWRDFLLNSLDNYMPQDELYHLLYTAPLVGLFTCVFVKSSLQGRIRNLNGSEVKRGMGGLHGNKGAIVVRFQVDDSSLCFVNCHLAAGQTQSSSRHADVAAILEATLFPAERDPICMLDNFSGGGDGSMILDHEICILNGDLNYRIDTMSQEAVVKTVRQGNLAKLLERDQLLVAYRRNPAFRLRAFDELPIMFNPTYKYDVGTDTYDTSEKRRSPAWCDRVLYRGPGKVLQLDYKRHDVRVSDHRPVTASFKLRTKKVDARARAKVWMACQQRFEDAQQKALANERIHYLEHICGFDEETSKRLAMERVARRNKKTNSGNRG